jgi:hypothetical protein
VVNNLVEIKLSSKMLFHNVAVLVILPSINLDCFVSDSSSPSLLCRIAFSFLSNSYVTSFPIDYKTD